MMNNTHLFPNQILELYAQVSCTGQLTHTDKLTLESALSNNSLDKEEKIAIQRLFYALRRGYFHLVDS
ncbi:hypothetical protein [Kamptonema sp. UHCC 0994]|uniref:hypothetical protein n=1 Tax=Kamptonema sp. UHCC 0994 TaxID=3031329 RepID=UPI0023B89464|nr:hypothetical protein [Kamptonema sp. UHCC 0994]MDF0552571.1 hypothetical protein [Kamptonema sp. UHCC 0994]